MIGFLVTKFGAVSADSALDPQVFLRGTKSDLDALKSMSASRYGREALERSLSQLLTGYLAADNFDDENIRFAGHVCNRAGLRDAGLWVLKWQTNCDPELRKASRHMALEFLYGFSSSPALRDAILAVAMLIMSVEVSSKRASKIDDIDLHIAAIAAMSWELAPKK